MLLLTVVLALGGLCVWNYQVASRHLLRAQARLAAEGAAQDFMYRFDAASRSVQRGALDLETRAVDDLHLDRLYPTQVGLPHPPTSLADARVRLSFDRQQSAWSTDNSCGDCSSASWRDQGTSNRSVPPFCVNLVLHVSLGGTEHAYEVTVTRRWPYAAFCGSGAIAVTGAPLHLAPEESNDTAGASRVDGAVATLTRPEAITLDTFLKYDSAVFRDYYDVAYTARSIEQVLLAAGRAEDGRVYLRPRSAISIGPGFAYSTSGLSHSTRRASRGNVVTGSASVGSQFNPDLDEAIHVAEGNELGGRRQAGNFPEGLDTGLHPVEAIHLPAPDDPGLNIIHLPLPREYPFGRTGGVLPADRPFISRDGFTLLDKDLVVDPDAPRSARVRTLPAQDLIPPSEFADPDPPLSPGAPPLPPVANASPSAGEGKGTGMHCIIAPSSRETAYVVSGGRGNRFVLHGSLGNRRVLAVVWQGPGKDQPSVRTSPPSRARLVLRNCTLLVHGSLDLSGDPAHGVETALEGTNATLLVDGTLVLGGGRLYARDQGMVLFARNVVMRAQGDYKGMIVARQSLLVLTPSQADDRADQLRIRGGLLAGGAGCLDLVLRSTHLTYEPTFLKALHAFGEPTIVAWSDLP